MKKRRYFSYKKRGHIIYNCSKKGKIAAISVGVSKNNNNQEKKQLLSKLSLFVSLLFLSENLFCKNLLTIQYTLRNKIKVTILVNTCATRFSFIDEKFAGIICKKLKI